MYPQISPRILYNPDLPYGNFHVDIVLPEDYYEIVPGMKKERISEMMERHSDNLSRFYASMVRSFFPERGRQKTKKEAERREKVIWQWDEKRGLYFVELHIQFLAPQMFLEEDGFEYQTHNLTLPLDALMMAMIGLDYLSYVNSFKKYKRRK